MEDLLLDIKTYLASSGIKEEIFRDAVGDTPDVAIVLYEYQGANPIAQIAGSDRAIQFVVRGPQATLAKTLIKKIYKLLETEDSILNFTSERWAMVHLNQTPFKMKVDEKGRSYYVFNTTITTYIE